VPPIVLSPATAGYSIKLVHPKIGAPTKLRGTVENSETVKIT